jgi:decaprenyl-phosphate phosphoribosyltransferase
MGAQIKGYVRLLRPQQALKNVLVFAPLFFALQIAHLDLLAKTALAALLFYFVSAAIYVFNDYRDIEHDRQHPTKKFRPLASGLVNVYIALALAAGLLSIGTFGLVLLSPVAALLAMGYLLINFGYSMGLKNVPIVDIAIVASGFIIRIYIGSYVAGIPVSGWLEISVFLISLLFALTKRRSDVIAYRNTNVLRRKVVSYYNLEFIDHALNSLLTMTIICYLIYTLLPETMAAFNEPRLYLTGAFVVLGGLRILQRVYVANEDDTPKDTFLRDPLLWILGIMWLVSFGLIVYL